jgi:5-methylcytosine-specific restriction endonuclease McrA
MYTCRYCAWVGPDIDFEVDHILPKSRGGSDAAGNLQIICSGCNREKGERTHEEYVLFRIVMGIRANRGPVKS